MDKNLPSGFAVNYGPANFQVNALYIVRLLIPSEILIFIFEAAMDLDSSKYSAVAISQVCSRWRDLALQTPHLWNHIKIALHTHPERVAAYLHRSKTCPLHVSIEIALCSHNHHICPVDCIIGIFLPHNPRWRIFALSVKNLSSGSLGTLLKLFATPRLEEVSITFNNTWGDLGLWSLIPLLRSRQDPSPNHLKTFNLAIYNTPNQRPLLFYNFEALLDLSPSLEKISLHGCSIMFGSGVPQPLLNAPSLRSFSLHHHHQSEHQFLSLASWLLRLNAPHLQSLELGDTHYSDWLLLCDALIAMPKTFSGLRKLWIQMDAKPDDATLALAEAFLPNLEDFKVIPSAHVVPLCNYTCMFIIAALLISGAVCAYFVDK